MEDINSNNINKKDNSSSNNINLNNPDFIDQIAIEDYNDIEISKDNFDNDKNSYSEEINEIDNKSDLIDDNAVKLENFINCFNNKNIYNDDNQDNIDNKEIINTNYLQPLDKRIQNRIKKIIYPKKKKKRFLL